MPAPGPPQSSNRIFVARQPIFKRSLRVYGYELLFRSGLDNFFDPNQDGDTATSKLIANSFSLIGISKITEGKKAFINFTDDMLLKEYATLFPREITVAEVLEDVRVTREIISACQDIVAKGYILALDDYVFSKEFQPLVEIAHIIKFDIQALTLKELEQEVRRLESYKVLLLAEKVETREEYEAVKDMGFTLFQGYFFSKPNIIQGRDIPGSKLQYLQILRAIEDKNFDFKKITEFVSRDVSLSFKLLKYVNSAAMRRRVEVTSLQRAVALIGEQTLRKWLSLMMLSYMADEKPVELLRLTLLRARFCEQVGEKMGKGGDFAASCYTVGMFSLLDVILDQPMNVLLRELNLSATIVHTLVGDKKTALSPILKLAQSYERGEWGEVIQIAGYAEDFFEDLPLFYERALLEMQHFYSAL
ncbi:MAG: HDOD domain-containing protein [Desulfobulbaceae bacterium]|nr:HDOD domain-containing protein [Desulfobulbaceae bacterium]